MSGKKSSSSRWLDRQRRDCHVKAAHAKGYRSRAWFKLEEISKKFDLFPFPGCVFDLGAAPGGWSQFLSRNAPAHARLMACDLLPMHPIARVEFIQGNFLSSELFNTFCTAVEPNEKVSTILSDMAPNLTGQRVIDEAQVIELLESVWNFAQRVLSLGGVCLLKGFQGPDFELFAKKLRLYFKSVVYYKPVASRLASKEIYVIALHYKALNARLD